MLRATALVLAMAAWTACGGEPTPASYNREALLDSNTCQDCHPTHFAEWSSSMHAYAADDPVFLAMNARGQRETNGELGSFCVNCHAPMAVLTGATTDGLNLATVDPSLKGVTCYFCHNAVEVTQDHNAGLRLAMDATMRGGLSNPLETGAHASAYSGLHAGSERTSAALCGACHDVVTPRGVHLERTFLEWKESIFGQENSAQQLTCAGCHMIGRDAPAATSSDAPMRRTHEHLFPGVDLALTAFPGVEAQRAAIQRDLDPTVLLQICVGPTPGGTEVEVTIENQLAGHGFPSGAAQDRRVWLELTATLGDKRVFETGVVPADQAVTSVTDPNLWLFRDKAFSESGQEAHMFWDIAKVEPNVLSAALTADKSDPRYFHGQTKSFNIIDTDIDKVEAKVHIRPIDHDLVEDLVKSGDLDPKALDPIPTFTLKGTERTWEKKQGFGCFR